MNGRYRSGRSVKSKGLTTLGWLLMFPVALIVLLILAIGFYEGRKAYWDSNIADLCEKEGHVQIFEQVVLTKREADLMPRLGGKIATRAKGRESISDPVYSERKITYLREANPRVSREEVTVIRRTDQKMVARWVEYARVGGDAPTGIAHHSSFRCPDPRGRLEQLQRLFVVRED